MKTRVIKELQHEVPFLYELKGGITDKTYTQAGTYGPSTGVQVVDNVVVTSKDVVLRNMEIRGDLRLEEQIGDGDVHLKNVTVKGETIIRGGGPNSIHFEDSVLATVIVNKNDGKIRIVAKGRTQIIEVQLESHARLEEENLNASAPGFENVNISESVQTNEGLAVELIGEFETINSRATQVRIDLSESTTIREVILNVVAHISGLGTINMATINAAGSTLSTQPQNVVLNTHSVSIRDQVVNESYSDATSSEIQGIVLDMTSIQVDMNNFMADLREDDFKVVATLDGEAYQLRGLYYDVNARRFTFYPVEITQLDLGKVLEVTVSPNSDKLTGQAQTAQLVLQTGFAGRITDVQGIGIANVTINFRAGANVKEGQIVATATTDSQGYYTVAVEPGDYTGELSGPGILRTYLYAIAASDYFSRNENETAIRATAMDAVKIVLTWGQYPRDEDSHLEGPTTDGERFHVYFGHKIHEENGIRHVDLDWDDTQSYGPETTSIYKLVDGKYKFYVHNWSGEAQQLYTGPFEVTSNTFITAYNHVEGIQAGYVRGSSLQIGQVIYEPVNLSLEGTVTITTNSAIEFTTAPGIELELRRGFNNESNTHVATKSVEGTQLDFMIDNLRMETYTLIIRITINQEVEEFVKEIVLSEAGIWESNGSQVSGFEKDIFDSKYKLEINFNERVIN